MVVAYGATSLGNKLHTTLVGTLDIVTEGEEGVRAQSNLGVLGYPLFLLCQCQHLGLLGEELLPSTIAQYVVVFVFRDVHVYRVVAVGTANTFLEGQCEHLRMLAQPPDVGLVASQTGTVDTALLAGTNTDGLSVLDIAYRVRLGVLQRDESNNQVALGLGRERLVPCGDIFKQGGIVQFDFVTSLFEGHTEALLRLNGGRLVRRINLDNIVGALTLILQYFDSFGCIVGSNDTVADLALQ